MSGPSPHVRMSRIVRRFGSTTALDGASLELYEGEVHGVLGENGAGKTTLLNVLGGMLAPDGGEVEIGGVPVHLRTPRDAWGRGVAMVHQHFTLVSALTVLENLALGRRTRGHGFRLPYREVRRRADALGDVTGFRVELDRPVAGMGVGARQRVEILKALLRDPRVLVLDEPTAVLTPDESEALFALLRGLARAGRAVVLVAHKLDEILAVADRVTVLREGRTVFSELRPDTDAARLVRAMVGPSAPGSTARAGGASERARGVGGRTDGGGPAVRDAHEVSERLTPRGGPPDVDADVVVSLRDVGVRGRSGDWALRDVALEVRRGEVVGIAGVEGNGQRELALLLAGRVPTYAGRAHVPGGVGFIPQDRTTEGLITDFDLTENVALAFHDRLRGRGPWMPWRDLRRTTGDLIERFDVRAPGPAARARALSGGNQQKLVVGRELAVADDLLVAENPTRGLDVGAARFVHEELGRLAHRTEPPAPGIVLISSDLDEVLARADRLFVLVRGRLTPVPEGSRSREGLGALMLGGPR